RVIIETKVDSGESYLQTQRVFDKYSKLPVKHFFFYVTYGLSEFYISRREDKSFGEGACCLGFDHIKCQQMYEFIKAAISKLKSINITIPENLEAWEKWLEFELIKRKDNAAYLKDINNILCRYKATLNLTDYPRNRTVL